VFKEEFYNSSKLSLIAYDQLPINYNTRANNQIVTVTPKFYFGHEMKLLEILVKDIQDCERGVILIVTNDDTDDYVAYDLGVGMYSREKMLFDIFVDLGLFPQSTHHYVPRYIM